MTFSLSEIHSYIVRNDYLINIGTTLIWAVIFFILKWSLLAKARKTKNLTSAEKANFRKNVNSYLTIAFLIVLAFVWFSHLQSLLVSLVAVAAALVLATKEIIMCITGGVLIRIADQFKQGDRIEIDGIRGFVIQKRLTTTKLLEIGPEANSQQTTGKILTIPNSLMLSKVVKNESFFSGYSINLFSFPVQNQTAIEEIESDLTSWAEEICSPYIEEAKKKMVRFSASEGIKIPSITPRTKLLLNEDGKIEVILKMIVKNSEIADIEQTLLRKYISKHKTAS